MPLSSLKTLALPGIVLGAFLIAGFNTVGFFAGSLRSSCVGIGVGSSLFDPEESVKSCAGLVQFAGAGGERTLWVWERVRCRGGRSIPVGSEGGCLMVATFFVALGGSFLGTAVVKADEGIDASVGASIGFVPANWEVAI